MTHDVWLARHPYLKTVADLHAVVDTVAAEISIPLAAIPDWNRYAGDFQNGVPLLLSAIVPIDLSPAEKAVLSLTENLAARSLPGKLSEQSQVLDSEMHCDAEAPRRAVAWLLDGDSFTPSHPGLLHYLGWTVLSRFLKPVVLAFKTWRDDERWLRNYCPTCGSAPAMAQLAGTDPERFRLLSCGCCKTLWRYRRTGCAFCGNSEDRRLAVLAVEGEYGLRIDYCEACRGYLKTYNGEGSEDVLLKDWTSLHLDVVARDRGLKRLGASLYVL